MRRVLEVGIKQTSQADQVLHLPIGKRQCWGKLLGYLSSKCLWLSTGLLSEELEEEGLFQIAQEQLYHFQDDRDICLAILSLLWSLLIDGKAPPPQAPLHETC